MFRRDLTFLTLDLPLSPACDAPFLLLPLMVLRLRFLRACPPLLLFRDLLVLLVVAYAELLDFSFLVLLSCFLDPCLTASAGSFFFLASLSDLACLSCFTSWVPLVLGVCSSAPAEAPVPCSAFS